MKDVVEGVGAEASGAVLVVSPVGAKSPSDVLSAIPIVGAEREIAEAEVRTVRVVTRVFGAVVSKGTASFAKRAFARATAAVRCGSNSNSAALPYGDVDASSLAASVTANGHG